MPPLFFNSAAMTPTTSTSPALCLAGAMHVCLCMHLWPCCMRWRQHCVLVFSCAERLVLSCCSGTVSQQPPVLQGTAKMQMAAVQLGSPYICSSPQTFHWILPGSWSLHVAGEDAAGNLATPQAFSWEVTYATGSDYTRFIR